MLERGDRRIFTFRQMADGDPWCLLSFSIPEAQRDVRHQLRKRLGWIGCGMVATGLWICPAFLADEVEEIVADLGAERARDPVHRRHPAHSPGRWRMPPGHWWDLDQLGRSAPAFMASQSDPPSSAQRPAPRASFSRFIRALDQWRILPVPRPGPAAERAPG